MSVVAIGRPPCSWLNVGLLLKLHSITRVGIADCDMVYRVAFSVQHQRVTELTLAWMVLLANRRQ